MAWAPSVTGMPPAAVPGKEGFSSARWPPRHQPNVLHKSPRPGEMAQGWQLPQLPALRLGAQATLGHRESPAKSWLMVPSPHLGRFTA